MATEFGPDVTQVAPLNSALTPQPGVRRAEGFSGLANIFDTAAGALRANQKDTSKKTVGEFTRQQLLLAQGVDQGVHSSAFARTKMRQNLLAAVEANPSLSSDLVRAQAGILGIAGGAQVVDEGTEMEQRQRAARDFIVSQGLESPNASDAELDAAYDDYVTMQRMNETLDQQLKTINLKLKSNELSQSQRRELEARRSQATWEKVKASTPVLTNQFGTTLDQILASPTNSSEQVQAIEQLWTAWNTQMIEDMANMDPRQVEYMKKPFEMMYESALKRARGEYGDAQMKREIDRSKALATNLALTDPRIAQLAAAKDLMGEAGLGRLLTSGAANEAWTSYFEYLTDTDTGNTSNVFTRDAQKKKGLDAYLDSVTSGINSNEEGVRQEATDAMVHVLTSVEDMQGILQRDPLAGRSIVTWMASNEFLKARQANPDAFGSMDAVREVLERHYDDEVWGMVEREFRDAKVETGRIVYEGPRPMEEMTESSNLVRADSNASGVNFVPIDASNRQAVTEARRLNKDLKPIINEVVHAAAHANGNSNYQQAWEEVADEFLGGGFGENSGGDAGDDVNLEDFLQTSALDEAVTTGGYVGSGDYQNQDTPEDVAASFIGFKEQEHKDVLAAFIRSNTDFNIDPEATAWCAAFVNAAFGAKGVKGTNKLTARSFLEWGTGVSDPRMGDVAVFERGNQGWQGHVGFFVGRSERPGYVRILGGNQNNSVSIKEMPEAKLLGYRRNYTP